jgi:hypothetical protein
LRRRSEHAPNQQRTGNNPPLFKVKRQIRLQAKSTAKSANREKSSKLAFNPDKTGSPVDLGRRIPAKNAHF